MDATASDPPLLRRQRADLEHGRRGRPERAFVGGIVRRFQHHRNPISTSARSRRGYTHARAGLAERSGAPMRTVIIGNHHHSDDIQSVAAGRALQFTDVVQRPGRRRTPGRSRQQRRRAATKSSIRKTPLRQRTRIWHAPARGPSRWAAYADDYPADIAGIPVELAQFRHLRGSSVDRFPRWRRTTSCGTPARATCSPRPVAASSLMATYPRLRSAQDHSPALRVTWLDRQTGRTVWKRIRSRGGDHAFTRPGGGRGVRRVDRFPDMPRTLSRLNRDRRRVFPVAREPAADRHRSAHRRSCGRGLPTFSSASPTKTAPVTYTLVERRQHGGAHGRRQRPHLYGGGGFRRAIVSPGRSTAPPTPPRHGDDRCRPDRHRGARPRSIFPRPNPKAAGGN